MPSPAEVLQIATARFIENAKDVADCVLDGSPRSLLLTSAVMQKFHTLYQRAAAAKDPTLDKFVRQVSMDAAAYISTIFVTHFKSKLGATKDGKLVIIAQGVNIPILELMEEEVKTGTPHSLMLIKKFDDITVKNTKPELLDSSDLPAKAQAAAAVAVQDVRAMLKKDLDFTFESFPLVDLALQRLKAIAEVSPANKSNVVRASCDKYGSYIGETLIKQLNSKWLKMKLNDSVVNAIDLGSLVAIPSHIVQAVLDGKSLHMGEKSAHSVVQFLELVLERKKTAMAEGLFRNLDTPGELFRKLPLMAEEGLRIAKVNHGIDLDFTLFSLPLLDEVIAKERQRIEADRPVLTEENFQFARAASATALGVYLGEVILRAHGGSWVDRQPWPKLDQHNMKFDPLNVVGAFLRGEPGTISETTSVVTAQQYYQGIRPGLHDVLEAKLYGPGGSREQLLSKMGSNRELNDSVLHFAEACLAFSYSHCNIELDFSEDSLREVDKMLEQFHKNTSEEIKANPVLDRLNLIHWFGCYSGEVIRRTLGGSWANDASGTLVKDDSGKFESGPNVAHLNLNGNRIFVLNKVRKFLENGIGDSVAFLLHSIRHLEQQGEINTNPQA